MPNLPALRGRTSLSGSRWIEANQDGCIGHVPYELCAGPVSTPVIKAFADRGIMIVGKRRSDEFAEHLAEIDTFPPSNLIDRAGWSGGIFTLPDGNVFAPDKKTSATVVFSTSKARFERAGSLKAWKREVASPLAGQPIGVFALALAFVGPILDLANRSENFGFELVGKQGCGKSTMLGLMASVYGPPDKYVTTWHTTLNALESELPLHEGVAMILDEATLFFGGQAQSKRAASFAAVAFQIGAGAQKKRFGQAAERGFKLTYLSSSNEPLSALLGSATDVAKAAADRLITIPVKADRPYGIFDSVPDEYASSSALAQHLVAASRDHHGHAIRRFLKGLVAARATDEVQLRERIRALVSRFQRKAGIDMNDGSKVRVAEAFGLVFAAGALAKEYGALPKSYRCGPAVEAAYRLATEAQAYDTPLTRLNRLAKGPGVIDLAGDDKPGRKEIAAASMFLSVTKGRREFWMRRSALDQHFPDWSRIRHRTDVRGVHIRDKDRQEVYRKIGKERERVFCFRLPLSEDS